MSYSTGPTKDEYMTQLRDEQASNKMLRISLAERDKRIELLESLILESAPLRWAMSCHQIVVDEAAAWEKKAFAAVR